MHCTITNLAKENGIMKIYLVSYPSIMLNRGGPTYKLLQTHRALRERGLDVAFFNMWDTDLRLGKDDIVHIFNAGIDTWGIARNVKLYGARYVVNPIFYSNHPAWKLRMYQRMERILKPIFQRSHSDYEFTRQICAGADRVLPNTAAEGNLLADGLWIDRRKITTIYNGVEDRFARATPELFTQKYGLRDFVLYVGHLGPYRKNGKKIIQALQNLDHPAVIISDILHNEEGDWCRDAIGKSKNITLIEWLDHDDPLFASAYAACHTFILPTRYETPGRAALEAALTGANIVITPYGGTREYFGTHAWYPEPDSVASIQNAIEKALNAPRKDALKQHVLNTCIWPKIAEATEAVYRSL